MDIFAHPVSKCAVGLLSSNNLWVTVAGTKAVWERPAHGDLLSIEVSNDPDRN